MAALLGAAAKGVLAKLGGKAIGAIGRVLRKPAVRAAAGAAASTAITVAATRQPSVQRDNAPPPLPRNGAPPPGRMPGYSPGGTEVGMEPGIPVAITTPVEFVARPKAPRGYVIVDTPQGPIAMLAKVAYALGIKKRPRKSTRISSRDIEGAHKVNRFITKFSVNRVPKTKLKKGGKR